MNKLFEVAMKREMRDLRRQRDDLLEAAKRALPWLGKLIADGEHLKTVLPADATATLDELLAAVRDIEHETTWCEIRCNVCGAGSPGTCTGEEHEFIPNHEPIITESTRYEIS